MKAPKALLCVTRFGVARADRRRLAVGPLGIHATLAKALRLAGHGIGPRRPRARVYI